jgi:hypothetical protein
MWGVKSRRLTKLPFAADIIFAVAFRSARVFSKMDKASVESITYSLVPPVTLLVGSGVLLMEEHLVRAWPAVLARKLGNSNFNDDEDL